MWLQVCRQFYRPNATFEVRRDDNASLLHATPVTACDWNTMGSRSIGEALLRPSPFSHTLLWHSFRVRPVSPAWSPLRTIANSPATRVAQPQRKRDDDISEPTHQPSYGTANAANQRADETQVSRAIDDLFSGTNKPEFQRRTTPSSSDEVRAAHMRSRFGEDFGISFRRPRLDVDRMDIPDGLPPIETKPSAIEIPEAEKHYPRLKPSYGRTVELAPDRGRDIVRGIGMLSSLVARNKIRNDFQRQRFHERPGLKRKRLKSERWRARFKRGFEDVTRRVSELTRKGW